MECYGKHPKAKFSLKVGTIFEDSAISLQKWFPALWLLVNCKNSISSYELARALGVTQKTAWFMLGRLRMALHIETGSGKRLSGHVEADETFIGGKARFMHKDRKERMLKGRQTGSFGKVVVFGVLERNSPDKPSQVVARSCRPSVAGTLQLEIRKHVVTDGSTTLYTDALKSYEPKTPKGWRPSELYVQAPDL